MNFNYNRMWEVRTTHVNGWCVDEMCGYCESCRYIWKLNNDRLKKKGKGELRHDEWAKRNWYKHEILKQKAKDDREKLRREIGLHLKGGVSHQLFTIALPSDYDTKRMHEKVKELMGEDKWGMGESICSYEWYSKKKPEGGNLHIHWLVVKHGTYKPSVQSKKIAKEFGIEPNFVDYTSRNKPEDFVNRLNYILGNKRNDDFKYLDIGWRKAEGLPHITNGLPVMICDSYKKEFKEFWDERGSE